MRTRLPLLVLFLVAAWASHPAWGEDATKRVLILDSFGRNVAPIGGEISNLRAELGRQWPEPMDIFEVSLEMARTSHSDDEESLVMFLAGRLEDHPVSLVIPVGLPAVQFAARHRARLFPDAPQLLAGVDRRVLRSEATSANTVGVTFFGDLAGVIEGILKLLPETRNVYVVLGVSPMERPWMQACQSEFIRYQDRLKFEWWNELPVSEMQTRAANLPVNSVILYFVVVRDAAGVSPEQHQALHALRSTTNSPIFGYFESQMGLGIIGGRLMPDTELGGLAAGVAVRLLRGESPENMVIPPLGPAAPVYDWRELQHWNIPESRLPAGSQVQHRPITLWQSYRWQLIAVMGVLFTQSVLIAGLIAQRRRRGRAERALADNEHKLRLITDSLPVLIAYVDCHERYQFNNRAFQTWFGITPEAVRGRTEREVLGERHYQMVRPHVARALAGEAASYAIVVDFEDGGRRALEGIYVPDRAAQGDVRGLYSLVVDVTARDQARQEARRLQGELAHAGRVSLMGVLGAALAHELNQPLTAILSNAQAARRFLQSDAPNLHEVGEILDDIADDDQRASAVIQRMRALVKNEPPKFDTLDLRGIVRDVERLVHSDAILRGISVTVDVPDGSPWVHGDRIELQQVMLNLILNAFEAIDSQPESQGKARNVLIQARETDGQMVVAVRDTGPGIAAELEERLFEPFHTTKKQGLGMGLSISRSIIDLHDGRLWAENNQGRGATFYFSLPLAAVAAAQVPVESSST